MSEPGGADEGARTMRLRYTGTCRSCGASLAAGTTAVYVRSSRTAQCLECPPEDGTPADRLDAVVPEPGPQPDPVGPGDAEAHQAASVVETGVAGASAGREFERRVAAREQRIRTKHPKLGGLILALSDEPQSTTAWAVGAKGERMLGGHLDRLSGDGFRVLHDRRIPRTRANIDHLVVTTNGVHVVDAKRYRGRPRLVVDGGILRERRERLVVGSRDCTKLVAGVRKQMDLVRTALGPVDVPVHGVLCFLDADWPLLGGSFRVDGVAVVWPKKLTALLREPGEVPTGSVDDLHRHLAAAVPVA